MYSITTRILQCVCSHVFWYNCYSPKRTSCQLHSNNVHRLCASLKHRSPKKTSCILHTNTGFSPVCASVYRSLKRRSPQKISCVLHSNVVFLQCASLMHRSPQKPSCILHARIRFFLRCASLYGSLERHFPQKTSCTLHANKVFSPVYVRTWIFKALFTAKYFTHNSHEYDFSLVCTVKFLLHVNGFKQT